MFKRLDDLVLVSPQIDTDDVAAAVAQGVTMIINNRPDGESDDQTPGAKIQSAARAHGIHYVEIPVTHSGFSEAQVSAMADALDRASSGQVLAYCRTGTRSTLLWALAQASIGEHSDVLAGQAAAAGYDLTPVAALMEVLRSKA